MYVCVCVCLCEIQNCFPNIDNVLLITSIAGVCI